jgi:2-polyprenyl-3-methyl-5-hydroxy-6-metoxy-1,4-benzoquinol methylase
MFRVPKSNPGRETTFYQNRYREGFTTDCPGDEQLTALKQTSFQGTEKDYSAYIEAVKAAGVQAGDTVLDFGSSWGYGSWQLTQAGFRVYSYEISELRARYAAERLDCQMLDDARRLAGEVDCFFSAHVIEHLSDPRELWSTARTVLKPGGVIILFMPNGNRHLENRYGSARYHRLWGQVHPLLLTAGALAHMAQEFGFTGCAYGSPYNSTEITAGIEGSLDGDELLYVARNAFVEDQPGGRATRGLMPA